VIGWSSSSNMAGLGTVGRTDLARSSRQDQDGSCEILRQRAVGRFTLIESLYRNTLELPPEAYSHAEITLVIEGTVSERYTDRAITCTPGAVRFVPAGEVHQVRFDHGSRCLHIRCDPSVLEQFQRLIPKSAAEITGMAITWLTHRLYAEFSRRDTASAIAIEGLILEVLAEISRSETQPDSRLVPEWLKRATEIVEARFLERLSLADIASQVGIHYVHLSRQFHKFNRCTVGELIRRRRIQHACHLLAQSQTPLAEIALICGFSDQSHLSFLFKRYMGISPSKFRSLAGSSPATEVAVDGTAPIH